MKVYFTFASAFQAITTSRLPPLQCQFRSKEGYSLICAVFLCYFVPGSDDKLQLTNFPVPLCHLRQLLEALHDCSRFQRRAVSISACRSGHQCWILHNTQFKYKCYHIVTNLVFILVCIIIKIGSDYV